MFLFQVWKAVQALVGKTGKESLKRRCIECKPEKIPLAPAKRAKVLLEEYDLEEVRDVSAGAATFYVWVSISTSHSCISTSGPSFLQVINLRGICTCYLFDTLMYKYL